MEQGALIGDLDVAQLMLILFVIFFVALVLHLRQEDKREGYPLKDPAGGPDQEGFPPIPAPKTFLIMDGPAVTAPRGDEEPRLAPRLLPTVPGFPLRSTDPVGDAVGPAAYPMRRDHPMIFDRDKVQVLPMRSLPDWILAKGSPDPRGMRVLAVRGEEVGRVVDLWIDRSVNILRYLEVKFGAEDDARRALVPIYCADIKGAKGLVKVSSLQGDRFSAIPPTALPDTITAREEDRINAFFAGAEAFDTSARRLAL